MEILNLEQGTEEWHKARMECFTASEAPAMMGASKYMSRNKLLDLKKSGIADPITPFQQALFDKGHAAEELARVHIEMDYLAEFPPVVAKFKDPEIGRHLLASLDGFNADQVKPWEHKLWNETLAENVASGLLEPTHYWQLEHQCLVFGATEVIFTVSDGSHSNRISMTYKSDPNRMSDLLAGWKQFEADLEAHEVVAKTEVVEAEVVTLPTIDCKVDGQMVLSNIGSTIPLLKDLAKKEMAKNLETDFDFAEKAAMNTAVKKARETLKAQAASVRDGFASFSEFMGFVEEADGILQKIQSHGESQVKSEKEKRKKKIDQDAQEILHAHADELNRSIEPIEIISLMDSWPSFTAAMKGKRNLESMKSAVDDLVASTKAEMTKIAGNLKVNLELYSKLSKGYTMLFSDISQLITKDKEALEAIISKRIYDYEKDLQAKKEAAEAVEADMAEVETTVEAKPETNGSEKIRPTLTGASIDDDGVLLMTFGDDITVKMNLEEGDGMITVVEKLQQLGRVIINESKKVNA